MGEFPGINAHQIHCRSRGEIPGSNEMNAEAGSRVSSHVVEKMGRRLSSLWMVGLGISKS